LSVNAHRSAINHQKLVSCILAKCFQHSSPKATDLKHEYTVFQGPNLSGKNRQSAPPRSTQRKASTRKRSLPQRRPRLRRPLKPSRKAFSFLGIIPKLIV